MIDGINWVCPRKVQMIESIPYHPILSYPADSAWYVVPDMVPFGFPLSPHLCGTLRDNNFGNLPCEISVG